MLQRLRVLIIKELLSYFRDPKTRAIILFPPIIQLVIFSFAATMEVNNIDIATIDYDQGSYSQEITERLNHSSFVNEITFVNTSRELNELINQRKILLGLNFPEDFSKKIINREKSELQVIVDGRRANTGQVAFSYINAIVGQANIEISQRAVMPQANVLHWFNPNLSYRWFMVPSLTGTLAMMLALIITALSIARERELGTFDQLLVSPLTPIEIIIGKTIPALLIGTVMGLLMVTAAIVLFGIPFTGNLFLLFMSLIIFNLAVVGVGLSISAFCQTQQQAILGAFSLAVPLILISGFTTPVENMPQWLQLIAEANPLKHFLIIVQSSFLKEAPVHIIFNNVWPMILIALVTLSMATFLVKGRLQ